MTQVVKPDARQGCFAAYPLELARNIVRPQRGSILKAADIIGLVVFFSISFPVLVLPAAQIAQIGFSESESGRVR